MKIDAEEFIQLVMNIHRTLCFECKTLELLTLELEIRREIMNKYSSTQEPQESKSLLKG